MSHYLFVLLKFSVTFMYQISCMLFDRTNNIFFLQMFKVVYVVRGTNVNMFAEGVCDIS